MPVTTVLHSASLDRDLRPTCRNNILKPTKWLMRKAGWTSSMVSKCFVSLRRRREAGCVLAKGLRESGS